jgi:hypothetical protein
MSDFSVCAKTQIAKPYGLLQKLFEDVQQREGGGT